MPLIHYGSPEFRKTFGETISGDARGLRTITQAWSGGKEEFEGFPSDLLTSNSPPLSYSAQEEIPGRYKVTVEYRALREGQTATKPKVSFSLQTQYFEFVKQFLDAWTFQGVEGEDRASLVKVSVPINGYNFAYVASLTWTQNWNPQWSGRPDYPITLLNKAAAPPNRYRAMKVGAFTYYVKLFFQWKSQGGFTLSDYRAEEDEQTGLWTVTTEFRNEFEVIEDLVAAQRLPSSDPPPEWYDPPT